MCALLVAAYLDKVLLDEPEDHESLVACASLEKFLAKIVAIVVDH